jgi:hypothetical protein
MEVIVLLIVIGLTGALGCLTLGLAVFALKPLPADVVKRQDRRSVTLNLEAASSLPSATKGTSR